MTGRSQWPLVGAQEWCGQFAPMIARVGNAPKISDEDIVQEVKESTKEMMAPVTGELMPEMAYLRADLVKNLMERGMASTPAYKRIAGLVKRGLLCMGENPPMATKDGPGVYVWPAPESFVPEPVAAGRPEVCTEDTFLQLIVAAGCTSPETSKSMRALHRAACESMPMSVTTAHRLMKRLVAAGKVAVSDRGYYAVVGPEDVPE